MVKKGYSLLHVIIIIVVTSIVSGLTVGVIFTKGSVGNSRVTYTDILEDKKVQEFLDVYSELSSKYYTDVDKGQMIDSAINGMTTYFNEAYTSYLDKNSADALIEQLNGTYEGIGIVIQNNEIIGVASSSPAFNAGIQIGDKLITVNNIVVENLSSDEITSIIQSSRKVNLSIERDNQILNFNLNISTVSIPSVSYRVIENSSIGYLKINIFSNTLLNQVQDAINYLKKENINTLIIDLRDNTGGYLDQAKSVSSLFTQKGQTLYSIIEKGQKEYIKDEDNYKFDLPIVIIVNGSTASAAEIMTSALHDNIGAVIVGEKTFGKGKVQHTYNLSDGSLVKYTSSEWFTPKDVCIDGIGITPDEIVKNELVYGEDGVTIIKTIDRQFEKSVELLSQ